MKKIEEAITNYWGERCPDHEDECPVCQAWHEYDEARKTTQPQPIGEQP